MIAWVLAFLFTQAVEVPVYAAALRSRPLAGRLAIAFGASLVTHPIVWWSVLTFARDHDSYVAWSTGAELFAVTAEALWLKLFGVSRPLPWAILANAASLGLGLGSRALFGVP